jgi:antibiotic biosynthesis monooxygenase (ABM) superfamily enzyme
MYVVIELPRDYQNEVTTIICRKIKPGHEKDYNDWVQRYLTLERKAPGYLGTTIIIPGGSKSPLLYIIRRFADKIAMERWDNSRITKATKRSKLLFYTILRYIHWFGNVVYITRLENS